VNYKIISSHFSSIFLHKCSKSGADLSELMSWSKQIFKVLGHKCSNAHCYMLKTCIKMWLLSWDLPDLAPQRCYLASIDASECYISLFLNISKYAKLMLIVQNISHNLIVVQDYRQTRFLFKL